MVDSASAVPACARAVDAGRRTAKGIRAGCPDPFAGWRSGAAERVQAGAGGVESAIQVPAMVEVAMVLTPFLAIAKPLPGAGVPPNSGSSAASVGMPITR